MSEIARNRPSILQRWGGGAAAFFTYTHLSHDLVTGLLVALLPLIREGLGLSYLETGLVLSAFTITSGVSQVPGGWLGDRLKRQVVMAIGLTGIGLTSIAVGLSSSYYQLLFILVFMGLFAGAYHPSATSILSSQTEVSRRGKAIAVHMVGGTVGYAVGPVLGGFIAQVSVWRFAFILLGLPAIIAAPVVLRRFRGQDLNKMESGAKSRHEPAPGGAQTKAPGIIKALRPLAVIFSLVVLVHFISGSAMAFIPIYLVDRHAVSPTYAVMLISLVRVGGVGGSLFGGWLSDRWGRKNATVLTLVITGPVLFMLTRLPFSWGLIVVLMLFGMISYMRPTAFLPFLMDSAPAHLRGTIFGIYLGLAMEGMSLLQPVAGYYMDIFGIVEVFDVIALSTVAVSLITLVWARMSRKARQAVPGL
ncbi:MAG: MFS transporter [Chloroflexi bacterium]|nr:MFS transporter [Chloroflexota bacterium]